MTHIQFCMKEITLRIPDQKYDFFLNLVNELGLEITEEIEITEEQKQIVRERIQSENPDEMVPWEQARKQFVFDK